MFMVMGMVLGHDGHCQCHCHFDQGKSHGNGHGHAISYRHKDIRRPRPSCRWSSDVPSKDGTESERW